MIAILLALAVLQDPVVGPTNGGDWKMLDSIQLIVNEESVSTNDFVSELKRNTKKAVTTPADRDKAMQEAATAIVERLLRTQAGRDKGYDPKLVERYVREMMDDTLDKFGGVVNLGKALEEFDLDPQGLKQNKEAETYRALYENEIDGRAAGPGGRSHVDRYVRPGLLTFEYARRGSIDAPWTTVKLQTLGVSSKHAGGAEAARAQAQALYERAVAGEDFTKLVDDYTGNTDGLHGIQGPFDPEVLKHHPDIGAFMSVPHQVGDISEPLPRRIDGELVGFCVYKVVEVNVAHFDERPVQNQLRQTIEERVAAYRRDRDLRSLLGAAYVWPPEVFGRAKPPTDTTATVQP